MLCSSRHFPVLFSAKPTSISPTMLPLSVRRAVASAAPQSPATVVSSLAASAPKAAFKFNGLPQRRYSSSKPSSPDDGTRDFAARPAVPASGNSKTTGEKRKRKAKDAGPQLPSVPSTKHIKDEALALSTFFALHRPISVTQLLPKTVTEDAFAEIFSTRSPRHRVSDVLSTLSQTVHDLEEHPLSKLNNEANTGDFKQQEHLQQDMQDAEEGVHRLKLANGTETNVYFQLNSMAGQLLPYAPPPPPEPVSDAAAVDALVDELAVTTLESNEEPQTRVYKAMVTIEETVEADGQYKVVAHSPELIDNVEQGDVQPRTFLERMALRQLKYDESRRLQDRTMQAISVKRIRKLKMKKKKYKKLQKRTRNERRKLDRL